MKKALVLVLAVCALCALSFCALADSWDFLHTAIRLSTTDELEALAAETGVTVSGWGAEGDFDLLDFVLEGIPSFDANAYLFSREPTYTCILYFRAPEDSSAEEPGEAFDTLFAALLARYGEPTYHRTDSGEAFMAWNFEDATIYFEWSGGTAPSLRLSISGLGSPGNPKFPMEPLGITASLPDPAPSSEPSSEPFSFREGITGGMTMARVIAVEGKIPAEQTEDAVLYNGESVAGFSASLMYQFKNGKLTHAVYLFEMKHADENAYIDDFNAVNAALASKYGPAALDEVIWESDLFKDTPSAHGMAVSLGHLVFLSSWTVRDVTIDHMLNGEDFEILHGLAYTFDLPDTEEEIVLDTTGL
ncbi:MAG: hypothetical protein FWE77_00875 [Clostridia bacterium]|nr:hypothetical protein [Clostridia bacterium]